MRGFELQQVDNICFHYAETLLMHVEISNIRTVIRFVYRTTNKIICLNVLSSI